MEFGDNFVENEVDPAAEFLAREQNELAGLEDELPSSAPMVNGNGDINESSPTIDDFETLGVEDDQVVAETFEPVQDYDVSPPQEPVRERREEPEKIKKWREEQMKSLEEKDLLEEKKKDEWRLAAKIELEEWYKQHEDHLTKTRANNRNNQEHIVIEDEKQEPGTDWKRIAKLCDFNKKSTHNIKDASRMRSIILQLQQSPTKAKAV